jgi:hypothetical protein
VASFGEFSDLNLIAAVIELLALLVSASHSECFDLLGESFYLYGLEDDDEIEFG